MNAHDIQVNNQVAIVEGKDFDARSFGYRKRIANCDKFTLYYVRKSQNLKQQHKIFKCHYKDEDKNEPCDKVIHGITKFYCHMMSHTKEKPFRCTFDNCNTSFCQMGNLRMHIQSHDGVKKYSCKKCGRFYSKKHNLNMH